MSSDVAVRGTNDDATVSKLSCVKKGYFEDEFVHHFVRRAQRRQPLINRGYHSRVMALRVLQEQFLSSGGGGAKKQVLILGAGFDTTCFHMIKEGRLPQGYFEVDFAEVTMSKAATIAKTDALKGLLGEGAVVDAAKGEVHAGGYHLLPVDLRKLDELQAKLKGSGFDPNLPTFVLSECVLVYLPTPDALAVIQWAAKLPSSVLAIYEQIHPDDAFGEKMMENLESRGCPLLTVRDVPTCEAHEARLRGAGFARAGAQDMLTIHRCHLDRGMLARAERLEMMDEFEEWNLIQQHYAIAWGVNDAGGALGGVGFPEAQGGGGPARPPMFMD